MGCYYMAIDINETDGKHILGYIESGRLCMEEAYRFTLHWEKQGEEQYLDIEHLVNEIKTGLKICRENGTLPVLLGIDSWGGDVVLLDKEDRVINKIQKVRKDKPIGNPLEYIKETNPEYIEQTECIMMLPDYLMFCLSDYRRCEYGNALKTGLVNLVAKDWDADKIKELGYKRSMFPRISWPGTIFGNLRLDVTEEVGFDLVVVQPVTVNTSSALLAVAASEDCLTPVPASAIGNILVLMVVGHELKDMNAGRELVRNTYCRGKD